MKENKTFAEGICPQKICIVFIIFSILGCYYEMILELIKHYTKYGTIFWETRSGVIYGPFSIIYGFGAVIMLLLLGKKELKWYKILFYGTLIGGIFEYLASFFQEKIMGTTSWNYSHQLLNINGRTTIPIMLCWGIICLVFIKWMYPVLSNLIEKIPYQTGIICLNIIMLIICLDMLLSFSAVFRQNLRKNDIKPITFIGQFLDNYYPDKRIKQAYPNMKFVIER